MQITIELIDQLDDKPEQTLRSFDLLQRIFVYIIEKKEVTRPELEKEFVISSACIHNRIKELSEAGLIRTVRHIVMPHGGKYPVIAVDKKYESNPLARLLLEKVLFNE